MKNRALTLLLALALIVSLLPLSFAPAYSEETAGEGVAAEETIKATKPKPKKITISGSKYVAKGKKITLKATVLPEGASQSVIWTSGDTDIATVSSKGVVKGVGTGKVTITATSKKNQKVKKTFKITVTEAVKKVKITNAPKQLDLAGEKTVKLETKVSPSGAKNSVTWKSSDSSVATVSSEGVVTAVAKGTVTITATAADGSKKKAGVIFQVVDSAEKSKLTGDIQCLFGLTMSQANELLDEADQLKLMNNSYVNDYFYGYNPTGSDEEKIYALHLTKGTKYSVHGAKIGMTKSEAVSRLESSGLVFAEEGDGYVTYQMKNGQYDVDLELKNGNVDKILLIDRSSWGAG